MTSMIEQRVVGLIMAGGESRRLRPDKCWRQIAGVPMIVRVSQIVAPIVSETLVVGGTRAPTGTRLVPDESPGAGPLAAIATGMRATEAALYLVASCDIPLVTSELLRYLVDNVGDEDAVVPLAGDGRQPLCAVYARQCLPAINQALASGRRRADSFYGDVQVRWVGETELARFGSPERLFFNVNTPDDLVQAQQMIATQKGDSIPDGSR